jgi:anti-anti-sigma regulatory factor
MATVISSPGPALNLVAATPGGRLMLVDVEGELDAGAASRWGDLLNRTITDGATGIAVDLRSCPVIDPSCLAVLHQAAVALKESGGPGISLIATPSSLPARAMGGAASQELPTYSTAREALRSLDHEVG